MNEKEQDMMNSYSEERFQKAVELAERFLAENDLHMAIFVLRDLPQTKEAGLEELAWALLDGRVTRNEVRHFIDSVKAGKYLND